MKNKRFTRILTAVLAILLVAAAPIAAVAAPAALPAERTAPAALGTIGFEDTKETEYIPGAVLHHVDFTKVTNLADVGYFVTKANGATGDVQVDYTNEGLHLVGTDKKHYLVPSGVVLPKKIQSYTIEIEYKFVTANNQRYFCLTPYTVLKDDGTASHEGVDYCMRYGAHDGYSNTTANGVEHGKLKEGYTLETSEKINTARENFEFLTYQFHYVDNKVGSLTVWSSTDKIEATRDEGLGGMFGFMIGNNSGGPNVEVLIDHITVIAGQSSEYESLVWPEAEGENVLVASEKSLKNYTPDVPDTDAATGDTEANDTTASDTKAPEATNKPADTAKAEEKGGCGSSIGIAALSVVALGAGVTVVTNRKKKD